MGLLQVVGVAGGGLARLQGTLARVRQSVARPQGLGVVGPGGSAAGSAGDGGAMLGLRADRRSPPPTAPAEQEPQLLTEGRVQAAVDERVVAGGAHGQPVKAEVQSVGGVDRLAGEQHHVAVEGEPADGEHAHNQEQHGQRSAAFPPLGGVLGCRRVADGVVTPQPAGHRGVGGSDDDERQNIQQDEGQEINVLPVDI